MIKRNQWFTGGLLIYAVVTVAFYFLFPDFNSGFKQADFVYLIASFFPVAAVMYALNLYGRKGQHGSALTFMFLSFLTLFVGEALWAIFEFIGLDPYPSAADYFYIISYPLLFIGLLKEWRLMKVDWSEVSGFSKLMMSLITLALAGVVGYFGLYLAYDAGAGALENFVAMTYGVGDLILLVLAMFVLKMADEFKGGRLFYTWFGIFLGLIFTLFADIGFAIYYEPYEEGVFSFNVILDFLWIGSFMAYAYGFYRMGEIVKSAQDRVLKQ